MKIFLKNPTQAEVKEAINLALGTKRNSKSNKLIRHFGKLKLSLDGLKIQKKLRNEWS